MPDSSCLTAYTANILFCRVFPAALIHLNVTSDASISDENVYYLIIYTIAKLFLTYRLFVDIVSKGNILHVEAIILVDYSEMYKILYRSITQAITILQEAQQATEEIYISSEEPVLKILLLPNNNENKDNDC